MKENFLCQFWQKRFRPCALRFLAERIIKRKPLAGAQPTRTRRLGFNPTSFHAAFSLVEMLMALLVASLLMAALAPVMTKRMDEAKLNISGVGAAQYDKDAVIQIFTESDTFNVPNDVNSVKVTMMGGGGAGGDAFHGVQEFKDPKEIKSWKVPDGVTRLRVYMVGGGGGGASGGVGVGTAYADIPAATAAETCITKDEGAHTVTIPSNASWVVPALNESCKSSGVTKWTLTSDNKTEYTPGETAGAELKVTACGGGGGGGGSNSGENGGGGSGGYIKDIAVTSPTSTIYVKVGGGGGYGGYSCGDNGLACGKGGYGAGGGGAFFWGSVSTSNSSCETGKAGIGADGGTYGGKGGNGGISTNSYAATSGSKGTGTALSSGGGGGKYSSYSAGSGGSGGVFGGGGGGGALYGGNANTGGGGGGGGPTTISTSSGTDENDIIFQIGGGGGGGAGGNGSSSWSGGGGGGGGGYGAGGGGGGGGKGSLGAGGSGATYLSNTIGIGAGITGANGTSGSSNASGRGGGGGYGGASGANSTAGKIGTTTAFNSSSYCDGSAGSSRVNGKPGRIKICYGTSQKRENALKCTYNMPANGGGGGGAAQITIGEIDVTPGETLYFEVGAGGGNQATAGKNGYNGSATYIRRGSSTGTIIATALGGNAGQYSSDANVESSGGARLATRVFTMINNTANSLGNWLNKTFTGGYGGGNGNLASALVNKGFGGAGGNIQNMKAESVSGGTGGNSIKNGTSPSSDSYGAGGGGGAGAQTAGDTFGIGAAGTSGYIYIEYGGSNGGGGTAGEYISKTIYNIKAGTEIPITVGAGGKTGVDSSGHTYDGKGGDTKFGTYAIARGGLKGESGLVKDEHGGITMLPDNYNNYSSDEGAPVHGHPGSELAGGIGGYMDYIYQNIDNTYATFIKSRDGTIAGPILGGCGGNMSAAGNCNAAASGAQGKIGVFGGGGGGGAVVDGVGGLGGYGGNGVVIIEYKSTAM